jgi:hypothetical protein
LGTGRAGRSFTLPKESDMADPEQNGISDDAIDGLSVAPPDPKGDGDQPAAGSSGDSAQDGIPPDGAPDNVDIGSEESMDASDPPSTSAPGSNREVEQVGEAGRQQDA